MFDRVINGKEGKKLLVATDVDEYKEFDILKEPKKVLIKRVGCYIFSDGNEEYEVCRKRLSEAVKELNVRRNHRIYMCPKTYTYIVVSDKKGLFAVVGGNIIPLSDYSGISVVSTAIEIRKVADDIEDISLRILLKFISRNYHNWRMVDYSSFLEVW